jgi:hypothetical protein
MVCLKDLKTQWPWNPNHQDLSDKETYTHRVAFEDAGALWRVPILEPMNGFAYTGFRICVVGKEETYTMTPRLAFGGTDKGVFGLPWDQTVSLNSSWTPLGFPLTNKIIAITEDGLDLLIHHEDACCGKVEFVAQRFDDLLEDEQDISYIFLNHRTDKVEWILNKKNMMYKPYPNEDPVYRQRAKILPSVHRLLDKNRNDWQDTAPFWMEVNLAVPLLG